MKQEGWEEGKEIEREAGREGRVGRRKGGRKEGGSLKGEKFTIKYHTPVLIDKYNLN